MKVVPFDELYSYRYSVSAVFAKRERWRDRVIMLGDGPTKRNLLIYTGKGNITFTARSGAVVNAHGGDIVYIPCGMECQIELHDFDPVLSDTTGVNFLLHDPDNEPFVLSEDILLLRTQETGFNTLFTRLEMLWDSALPCPGRIRAAMYELLSDLAAHYRQPAVRDERFAIIAKGIAHLESEKFSEKSILEIAQMCSVSEAYFYKLFRKYAGVSPMEYRMESRIRRACRYLHEESIGIGEIAAQLGFDNVSYFSRQFKKRVGVTPSQYRSRKDK